MTPALKTSRGTKRHCQSGTCGLPFYDLNRTAIVCPNCSATFTIPVIEPKPAYQSRFQRSFGRAPIPVVAAPEEAAPADDALADAEELVEPAVADDDVLEVEDEGEADIPLAVEDEPQRDE